ncbi:MAG: tetratricopeptide repeat protein [Deltaproteobacteria bacterium]|nr:tetratricopeptide repeat protein [Deltaproteobacteria bacterium]
MLRPALFTKLFPRRLGLAIWMAAASFVAVEAAAPAPASAAASKKKKKKDKDKDKKEDKKKAATAAKEEEKKPEEKTEDAALKRVGAASFKVETTLDKKLLDRSQKADKKRDEAIEDLKKIIPTAPPDRKAEMIFRLAELYWEKSKFNRDLAMQEFEKQYQSWVDAGRPGKEPTDKTFVRESELIKENALKLYEKVLNEYPTYERNDEVLFYLGYNEYEAGNKTKAVSHYWTLIKQFPKSNLIYDAYLQLGEHFFNSNDVLKARQALERAVGDKSPPRIFNYALYKLAWCDYNVQEYAEGIKKLKDVIDRSEKAKAAKAEGGGDPRLGSEALGDLARFFSYVDEIDTAFDYFKKKGGEEIAIRYTTRLGELFHEQGKWDNEISTYRLLNDKFAMNPKAPELQSRIVTAYSKLNRQDLVRKEVERLVDLYRPNTPWYKTQEKAGKKEVLELAYDLTESNLRDLVTDYHQDAQKRQDIPTYQLARDIYKKYLEAFPSTESAYQMRYFYAEVLWALKEWKNAAEQYDKVVTINEKGKFARDGAYNAVLAWEKINVEGEKGQLGTSAKIQEDKKKGEIKKEKVVIKDLEKDRVYKEEPIPETELRLSAACDTYFRLADPKEQFLPDVKFKAAWIYYKHNHFVEGAVRYNEIIERWPGSDLSRKAANLILDSLNVQKKWPELEQYARGFRKSEKLITGDAKFKDEVQQIVEGASYKTILGEDEAARKLTGDAQQAALAKVATRFRGFRDEFEKSQYADKALYSSMLIYSKADELDHSIEAAELLLSDYKESDLREKTHFALAKYYEGVADFEKSARLYSSFYEEFKKSENAADALYNAGLFYQGNANSTEAINHYTKYIKDFEAKPDAKLLAWRICEILDDDKSYKKAGECWKAFYDEKRYQDDKGRIFEARYRYALTLEAQKKNKDALDTYKWIVANFPKLAKKDQETPGAQKAGAHASFWLLDADFQKYLGLKIALNKKSLEEKGKTANELACINSEAAKCAKQGRFVDVISYKNGDYAIAALLRIGLVFRDFAKKLREAPMPRGLTEDQIDIYRGELDALALEPEEKAIQAFELALQKAYELNIYNEFLVESQNNLKELNPTKFPDQQKPGPRGAAGFIVAGVLKAPAKLAAPAAAPETPADKALPAKGTTKPADEGEGDDAEEEGDDDTVASANR